MKKSLVVLLTACMAFTLFAGCGNNEENNTGNNNDRDAVDSTVTDVPNVTLADFNVDEIVSLGEYKGFEVTVPAPAVDDATLNM